MKIVVDIPKKYYDDFKLQLPILNKEVPSENAKYVIATGTPLPEGQENLIDINALEQQPCDDAISRQAAIDAMIKIEQDDIDQYGCKIPEGFDSSPAIEALENLPSVKPQYTDDEIQKMQEMQQAEIEKAYELGKAEWRETEE